MTDIKKYWEKLESSSEKPFYLNEVLELDKNDFFSTNDNIIKANNLIDGLYGGNFILIKNAINEKYLTRYLYYPKIVKTVAKETTIDKTNSHLIKLSEDKTVRS